MKYIFTFNFHLEFYVKIYSKYFLFCLVFVFLLSSSKGFPGGSDVKESTGNEQDLSSIPGLGRSLAGGHGNPLLFCCLENSMDGGA